MPRAAVVAAALALAAACHREIRPEPPRDVQAVAGVPLDLAPAAARDDYEWTVGDDPAAVARGPRFTGALPTAGAYEVRARARGQLAASFRVAVSPRSVLDAVPADAELAVYLPRSEALPQLAQFFNRAMGQLVSDSAVEHDPFLRYALSTLEGAAPADLGMDPAEGLALFRLVSGDSFAAIGVADDARALTVARRLFEERGFHSAAGARDSLVLERDTERTLGFLDRGYLYLVPGYIDDGEPHARLQELRDAIRAIPAAGLSADPELSSLRAQVPERTAMVFARRFGDEGAPRRIQAALFSLGLDGGTLDVDGRLRSDAPLWTAERAPPAVPLETAARGPVVALSASAPPEELARLLRPGVSEKELALAARVFEGDFALTLYFDSRATLRGMKGAPSAAAIAGALIAHAGIRDRADAEQLVQAALVRSGVEFKVRRARDATAYLLEITQRPVTIEITRGRLSIEAGQPLRGRPGTPLAKELRERFADSAFTPGHLSLLVDVGQVARELDPEAIAGSGSPSMVGFLSAFVRQATAVDVLFADLAPEPDGARLRARITLRPE